MVAEEKVDNPLNAHFIYLQPFSSTSSTLPTMQNDTIAGADACNRTSGETETEYIMSLLQWQEKQQQHSTGNSECAEMV